MLLTFWIGVIATLYSLWAIFFDVDSKNPIRDIMIVGLICNFSSIYYYRKVGWSELKSNSLSLIIMLVILIIIGTVCDYFF
jgi:hypothetical protein